MAEEMTPEEANARLVQTLAVHWPYHTGPAVDAILATHDALAALADPAEIAARWTPEQWEKALEGGERAGRVTLTDEDDELTVWLMRPGSVENAS